MYSPATATDPDERLYRQVRRAKDEFRAAVKEARTKPMRLVVERQLSDACVIEFLLGFEPSTEKAASR
jgi:hypothetical protein